MGQGFWVKSLFKDQKPEFHVLVCAAALILIVGTLNLGGKGGFLSILEPQHRNLTEYCTQFGFPNKRVASKYHAPEFRYQSHGSCRSRLEQHCYWHRSKYNASNSFTEALREYEKMHSYCAGKNLTDMLLQGAKSECKYVVWYPLSGLGNSIISLASTFVYSLLTNRTLLISSEGGIPDLFCEPFPSSSWILPASFPLQLLKNSKRGSDFYNELLVLLKQSNRSSISWADLDESQQPKSLKVVIANHPYMNDQDLRFFCPAEQDMVNMIPWIFWDSNNYMAPGLYFLPQYRQALKNLFPDQAVFLHVARYIFSPKDEAWQKIRTYYDSYFSSSHRKIGLQIRSWEWKQYDPIITSHTLACATNMSMLPHMTKQANSSIGKEKINMEDIAVLVASLRVEYYNDISQRFKGKSTEDGTKVSIYTASSEFSQRTGNHDHDVKAVMDMWLLSFMDDLITTPQSTFGEVAHGLAGVKPAVYKEFGSNVVPKPPCLRTNIQGPCFMDHPHHMACPLDSHGDIGNSYEMLPEIAHCELQRGVGITHA